MKTNVILNESLLTNIIEDDYAFYVQPEMYIDFNKFTKDEKEILNQLKQIVIEKTQGAFAKWSISQRAKWLCKYSIMYENKQFNIISRKHQGNYNHIFKGMMGSKQKMRLEILKRGI